MGIARESVENLNHFLRKSDSSEDLDIWFFYGLRIIIKISVLQNVDERTWELGTGI